MFKYKCDTCDGTGVIAEQEQTDYCTRCGGSGLVNGFFGTKDCPQCNGTGEGFYNKFVKSKCPVCSGKGWVWAAGEPDDPADEY